MAYRTAQEALTNVSKHAKAGRVSMNLSLGAGVLLLEVGDDGCGVASGALAKSGSFGLRGLHERAATVGGWIDLSSGAAGTTLILSVPLQGLTVSSTNDEPDFRHDIHHDTRHEPGHHDTHDDPHDPSAWGNL